VAECGAREYRVNLDGDDTDFEDEQPGPPELLAAIHRLRLGRGY
jgi:hypothetical protein